MKGLAYCGGRNGTAVSSSLIWCAMSLREGVRGASAVRKSSSIREGKHGCEHLQRGDLRDRGPWNQSEEWWLVPVFLAVFMSVLSCVRRWVKD
jgi:hypothetical protein